MKVSEFLTQTNYALRGTDSNTPEIGSEDANQWIYTLNRVKNALYQNVNVLFDESYSSTAPNEVGTVATTATTALTGTGTYFTDYRVGDQITVSGETVRTIATITSDTSLTVTVAFSNTASSKTFTRTTIVDDGVANYSLNRSFIAPANKVQIAKTDGQSTYVDFIRPREVLDVTGRYAYIHGLNPQVLTFSTTIASTEDIVGGSLQVPGYYMPDDVSLTDENDLIPLPDPYWGVMATAAEVAFNDITFEDKAPDLNNKANDLYAKMVRKNRRGTYGNPNKTKTTMYRIKSPSRR